MEHYKDPRFNPLFDALSPEIRKLAKKQFNLLEKNPRHPSLHFKRLHGSLWSARVGRGYRALASEVDGDFQWFWIGKHGEYEGKIK